MEKARQGTGWLRCNDVSEAFGIIKKSSNVITINRSNADSDNNLVVYLIDKSRHGKTAVAVECRSDYSCARTYLTDDERPFATPQRNVSHLIESLQTRFSESDEEDS